jgi:hypothetical protein
MFGKHGFGRRMLKKKQVQWGRIGNNGCEFAQIEREGKELGT